MRLAIVDANDREVEVEELNEEGIENIDTQLSVLRAKLNDALDTIRLDPDTEP